MTVSPPTARRVMNGTPIRTESRMNWRLRLPICRRGEVIRAIVLDGSPYCAA